jgi:hypothetical protein
MGKWVIAMVGLVAVMGVLLWQLSSDGPKKIEIQHFDAGPSVAIAASDAHPVKPRVVSDGSKAEEEDAAVVKYDPQSEEFSHEVDVGIPDGFRAKLARCERPGVDPDSKITINYRLHIDEGVVSASRVTVGKSNLGNSGLEQCMVKAVEQGRWVAADMPDFMEDQQLFIRIRSLNKYLDKDEQEAAKEADRVESED